MVMQYLSLAGGLRLLEVSLPEDVEDRDLDLEPDAEEEPVYDDEPVVTDGDAALGFPAGFAISLCSHSPYLYYPLYTRFFSYNSNSAIPRTFKQSRNTGKYPGTFLTVHSL